MGREGRLSALLYLKGSLGFGAVGPRIWGCERATPKEPFTRVCYGRKICFNNKH